MARFNPLVPAVSSSEPRDGDPYLSPQQARAVDFVIYEEGDAILEAVAGSGKTHTLLQMCQHLQGSVALCAFNKSIATELGFKLLKMGIDTKRVRAQTFHSFGFSAWRRVAPGVKVNGEKLIDLARAMSIPKNLQPFARAAVSLAKQACYGIDYDPRSEENWLTLVDHYDLEEKLYLNDDDLGNEGDLLPAGIEAAQRLLAQSIQLNEKVIDFDDMLFAPLLHDATFWLNDWVLIDEAQDTNNARLMMAERMLRADGRLIAVGDPRQAIYGFTGANADSMIRIEQRFNAIRLPLTVSFRCSRRVVAHANIWVPEIEAAPEAPEGSVSSMSMHEFRRIQPTPKDAVLCRVTKPLIEIAFDYIRRRIPVHVEGRDIGQGLLAIVRKWKKPKTVAELRGKIEEWKDREALKLLEKNQDAKLQSLEDKVDSLFCIMDSLNDDAPVKEIEHRIDELFRDTEPDGAKRTVTLSTVHKAKGREWDKVYLYGRNKFMPSKYAKQQWQIDQENNLIYVAVTRAKLHLVEVMVTKDEEPAQYLPPGEDVTDMPYPDDSTHWPPVGICGDCGFPEHDGPCQEIECQLGQDG
jgi:DNA helicase-2/ATP-dependent DNA helicase PcrA